MDLSLAKIFTIPNIVSLSRIVMVPFISHYMSLNTAEGNIWAAALMILAIHTGVLDKGSIFGVWLFFCLSGFLLASPFIRQPDRSLTLEAELNRGVQLRAKIASPSTGKLSGGNKGRGGRFFG